MNSMLGLMFISGIGIFLYYVLPAVNKEHLQYRIMAILFLLWVFFL